MKLKVNKRQDSKDDKDKYGIPRILVLDVNIGEIHDVEKEETWCWGLNW